MGKLLFAVGVLLLFWIIWVLASHNAEVEITCEGTIVQNCSTAYVTSYNNGVAITTPIPICTKKCINERN